MLIINVYQTLSSENVGYASISGRFLLGSFSSWNQLEKHCSILQARSFWAL